MINSIFDKLYNEGVLSDRSFQKIRDSQKSPLFSVHWELKTVLYLGILLLSTGLGIIVYKNIDSISHQVVLLFIAALTAGCFTWCDKIKAPFSFEKVESPGSFFDYILLLGTLSFLSFVGYLQFQYEVFGNRYGLATFLPMLVLFFIAYYFDHIGILTLAITNLAVWMGVALTPKDLIRSVDVSDERLIYTYLGLGVLLLTSGYCTIRLDIKRHFSFSYFHFGVHLTFIALLSGFFFYDYGPALVWLVLLLIISWLIYRQALTRGSFYFAMLAVIYGYIGISSFTMRSLFMLKDDAVLFLGFSYFILSGIGVILFLINTNKKMQRDDHLQ
ncbi:DUF2157 domain-containing protein [Desertivirga xinjiangensis]|uniref:DUF2157 domain-containing protein n=1 Tax=Desertivirga xinjiangensis TaxID=539206 RepID=UPI00210E44A5|nr:DUF2157 domain-containing protein [Pedobacter xinjiangensis]